MKQLKSYIRDFIKEYKQKTRTRLTKLLISKYGRFEFRQFKSAKPISVAQQLISNLETTARFSLSHYTDADTSKQFFSSITEPIKAICIISINYVQQTMFYD